MDHKQ